MPVLHPDAAGIDVGASELFVAVRAIAIRSRCAVIQHLPRSPRTCRLAAECGIRSVAMESTSVYWIPIYQILEARGLEVCLVNAQHVKNVPGSKRDVSDCQWIQYLHSVGLLRASFRPPGAICAVRALWRHRGSLIQMAAEHVLHIQKALDQMNLQIHRVLTEITDSADCAFSMRSWPGSEIRSHWLNCAIASQEQRGHGGEGAGGRLSSGTRLRPETVAESYRYYQRWSRKPTGRSNAGSAPGDFRQLGGPKPGRRRSPYQRQRYEPTSFDLRSELYRIFGVDLTEVPGISGVTAQTILCEIGPECRSSAMRRHSPRG